MKSQDVLNRHGVGGGGGLKDGSEISFQNLIPSIRFNIEAKFTPTKPLYDKYNNTIVFQTTNNNYKVIDATTFEEIASMNFSLPTISGNTQTFLGVVFRHNIFYISGRYKSGNFYYARMYRFTRTGVEIDVSTAYTFANSQNISGVPSIIFEEDRVIFLSASYGTVKSAICQIDSNGNLSKLIEFESLQASDFKVVFYKIMNTNLYFHMTNMVNTYPLRILDNNFNVIFQRSNTNFRPAYSGGKLFYFSNTNELIVYQSYDGKYLQKYTLDPVDFLPISTITLLSDPYRSRVSVGDSQFYNVQTNSLVFTLEQVNGIYHSVILPLNDTGDIKNWPLQNPNIWSYLSDNFPRADGYSVKNASLDSVPFYNDDSKWYYTNNNNGQGSSSDGVYNIIGQLISKFKINIKGD